MKTRWGQLRRRLLGLSPVETSFAQRGFRGATPEMRERLEQVGATFLAGYHAALEHESVGGLADALAGVELEWRGFAFEGAAMGLALLDGLSPWRSSRVRRFLEGPGDDHAYMVHVGVGWLWARMPILARRLQGQLDPMLGWLAFDGWGFHEGFFHWPKYIAGQPAPKRLDGYQRRAFDQGLGRSFWFVNGGNVELVAEELARFPADRQADLWSGIGLAATYAGLADGGVLMALRAASARHVPQLAQGAAFAAKARQRAGNLTAYTGLATEVLCGLPAREAARLCDIALENLPREVRATPAGARENHGAGASPPAYEIWRQRLQSHFQQNAQLQPA